MIIIHAFLKVNPKYRDDFLQKAKQVAVPSQAEEGNISYQFYENPERPNSFVFLEKWKDKESINYHEATAHFKQFAEEVQLVLSEPIQVEVFNVSEEG
ncbi:putative quinol monooxygenase [Domibacillus indicus]|uniref:putative quinol monooxygenase n=1 Tax=Domibacillus indicus TaxID=1437523 RepID=UPI000617B3D6|nr:putative quinol monooxygenase [Domibacillus indicus]